MAIIVQGFVIRWQVVYYAGQIIQALTAEWILEALLPALQHQLFVISHLGYIGLYVCLTSTLSLYNASTVANILGHVQKK